MSTFAVQIAKALGTEVTGVSSTRNLDMVRSIGANHVLDYTTEKTAKPPGQEKKPVPDSLFSANR